MLAMCALCQRICSPEEHTKKLADLRRNPKKIKSFLNSIEKNETQTSLAGYFRARSS